jgi:hypothetical protein
MERPELLACIEQPNPDPKKDEEPVEAVIWEAMGGLAQFSQDSVIDQTGVFVRLESVRTEKHQTRYQPLQPDMDKNAIVEHARPWQQMLMFFARTQRGHEWKSPKYRFHRRQREAWEALVQQAQRGIGGDGDEMDGDEMDGDEMDGEEMDEDDVDEDEADEGIGGWKVRKRTEQKAAKRQTGCRTFRRRVYSFASSF